MLEIAGCVVVVAELGVDVAAVGEGVGGARRELDGVVEIGERVLVAAEAMEGVAADFVEVGFVGELVDGSAVVSDGFFGSAHGGEELAAIAIGDGHAGAELDDAIEVAEGFGAVALLSEADGAVVESEPAVGIELEGGVEIGEGFGVVAGVALELAMAVAGPGGEAAKARGEVARRLGGEALLAELRHACELVDRLRSWQPLARRGRRIRMRGRRELRSWLPPDMDCFVFAAGTACLTAGWSTAESPAALAYWWAWLRWRH